MKEVLKSSMRYLASRHKEVTEGNPVCPPSLSSAVSPLREKLSIVKERLALNSGGKVLFEELLAGLSDGKLSALQSLVKDQKKPKNKSRPSEDKIYEVVQLVSADFEALEQWQEHIKALQSEVIETFLRMVLSLDGGEDDIPKFNLTIFYEMIEDTVSYRRGLRRSSQREDEPEQDEQQNSCCLM